jgi:hypothetical protein
MSRNQQRRARALHPRQTALPCAAIPSDVSVRTFMAQTARTLAFGVALMVGLVLTWLGAVASSYLDRSHGLHLPAQGATLDDPVPAPLISRVDLAPDAIPMTDAGRTSHLDIDPDAFAKLEVVLDQLDRDVDRSAASDFPEPSPPQTCESRCDASTPPLHLPDPDNSSNPASELTPPQASPPAPAGPTPDVPSPDAGITDRADTPSDRASVDTTRGPQPSPAAEGPAH